MLESPSTQNYQIHQVHTIAEAKTFLTRVEGIQDPSKHAFMFDLDNMLVKTKDVSLGGDQWFRYMFGKFRAFLSDSISMALAKLIPIYNKAHVYVPVQPVEQETVELIKALQDKGCVVFANTSRGADINGPTQRQMQEIGVDFNRGVFKDRVIWFNDDRSKPQAIINGVLHCSGGSNKGACLVSMLNHFGLDLQSMAFFDDKRAYIDNVIDALQAHSLYQSIQFVGFEYLHCLEEIKHVDWPVSLKQYEKLGITLSDDEARALIHQEDSKRQEMYLRPKGQGQAVLFTQNEQVKKALKELGIKHKAEFENFFDGTRGFSVRVRCHNPAELADVTGQLLSRGIRVLSKEDYVEMQNRKLEAFMGQAKEGQLDVRMNPVALR